MRGWLVVAVLFTGCTKAPVASYVDARACAACHASIASTYSRTGMARAFTRASAGLVPLGKYDHAASGRSYEIAERNGRVFQTRTAKGLPPIEREIHYVMGSGNKARTFLHRTAQGRLVELPLGWYNEAGGTFAMSPGYDRPAPLDFRRKISTDCMFCHNGYPSGPDAPAQEPAFPETLPEGIDCQRCHGPGSLHIAAGGKGGIVNPAKLAPDRGMEICMQCHLETTSAPLPNSLVRFGRGAFSYRPGEPLSDFILHFDHAPSANRGDKFEIVNSAYRLRQSRCFTASAGKLGCTTCHNPHSVTSRTGVSKACAGCHAGLTGGPHTPGADCASCHMPVRRTEDVIHAVMTDHKIVRRPLADLTAHRAERRDNYQGEVTLYYPPAPPKNAELEIAVAQVVQKSNLRGGIARLAAIETNEPRALFALGEAYEASGDLNKAETKYRESLAFPPAVRKLGELLTNQGKPTEAITVLEKAPVRDAGLLYALGMAYRAAGRPSDAVTALQSATAADPDFPEAFNALGGVYIELRDGARALAALQEAVRQQPDFAEALANLGQVLAAAGDYAGAETQLREALRWKPELLSAWQGLGELQAVRGQWALARASYLRVLQARPGDEPALLGLGTAQAATGDIAGARATLTRAAQGRNPAVRAEAMELLAKLR